MLKFTDQEQYSPIWSEKASLMPPAIRSHKRMRKNLTSVFTLPGKHEKRNNILQLEQQTASSSVAMTETKQKTFCRN